MLLSLGTQYSARVIAFSIALAVLCGLGAFRLTITADYRVFFSEDNPQLIGFEQQEALFYRSDTVAFVLTGRLEEPRAGAAVGWLTDQASTLPFVERVIALSNIQYAQQIDGELHVTALVPDPGNITGEDLERIRLLHKEEPGLVERLASRNRDTTLVVARMQLPGVDLQQETPQVVTPARQLVAEFRERWPMYGIHLFGIVPFNQTLSETTFRDLWFLFPVSIALMMLGLVVLLGGLKPALVSGCVILFSVTIAMGTAGWLGVVLTTATAVAPVIILTLAIAHSVHLFSNFQQALESAAPSSALQSSLRLNFQAVSLTSLTTIIGFLSLNFSDAPPFRELGNIVALGVFASWVGALFLLPALVTLLGAGRFRSHQDRVFAPMARWICQHHTGLVIVIGLCLAPAIYGLAQNQINDVFREWFSPTDPVRAGFEVAIDRLQGAEDIHYTLDSGQPNGVLEPDFIAQLDQFATWLGQQPEVAHISDYRHILKRMNRVLRDDHPDQYVFPESASLARQFLTVYELSLPAGHSLNSLLDLDKRRARLTLTMRRMTSSQLQSFDNRARNWLHQHAPAIQTGPASGALMMFAELGQRNIRSMLLGSCVALVAISALLIVALRSWRIGLISLVPNLLPAMFGFAWWGWHTGEINIAITVVMGMTLGIVVDDTIHFLSKYLHARRELGLNTEAAIVHTFHTVGRALAVTSAVLVGGFSVLAYSDFRPTADMGTLTAVVIALALILDFLLLPSLLLLGHHQKETS